MQVVLLCCLACAFFEGIRDLMEISPEEVRISVPGVEYEVSVLH